MVYNKNIHLACRGYVRALFLNTYFSDCLCMFHLCSRTECVSVCISSHTAAQDHNGYPRGIACSAVLAGTGQGTLYHITEHQH